MHLFIYIFNFIYLKLKKKRLLLLDSDVYGILSSLLLVTTVLRMKNGFQDL